MDYDYGKRGYLLPEGCKDLTDVIQPVTATAATKSGFVVTVPLPGLKSGDIEITAFGSTLRIVATPSDNRGGSASAVEVSVPDNYALAKTRAEYSHGRLRIVVPKGKLNIEDGK